MQIEIIDAKCPEARPKNGAAETEELSLEPPFQVSLLDQARAEATLKRSLELARQNNRLAKMNQALLAKRIAYLEERAELPCEALEAQLEKLAASKQEIQAQVEAPQRTGDEAEVALYSARQQLAHASQASDQRALEAWVSAHQDELAAARSGVDSLASAIANLEQMGDLWEQRYQLMHDPEALDLAGLLRQLILETTTAVNEKDAIESNLNLLRSMQLAQTGRLRDAGIPDAVREAMAARSVAHDLAERYGRELLETKEALIALLQGMRPQVESPG